MHEPREIVLVDNTLREGEQTPGVAFSVEDKLAHVRAMVDCGVTHFDAAVPESGPDEMEFLRRVRTEVPAAAVGASCRLIRKSIEQALDAGVKELFVIVPVSDVHLQKRLHLTRAELLEKVAGDLRAVGAQAVLNIALEDGFRADEGFLMQAADAAAGVAAARVFLADTVGIELPPNVESRVARVRERLPTGIALGTHFHNDFGLAVANTLAAIRAGATFATAAVNGLGERAGNTDIAVLAAAIRLLMRLPCSVRLDRLRGQSLRVMDITGILVSQTSPVTGYNAFRHTSGIHVHGVLSDPATYEAVAPEQFGAQSQLVLGKHSGRAHLRHLLRGKASPDDERMLRLLAAAKQCAQARRNPERIRKFVEEFLRFNQDELGMDSEELLPLLDEKKGQE